MTWNECTVQAVFIEPDGCQSTRRGYREGVGRDDVAKASGRLTPHDESRWSRVEFPAWCRRHCV
jgi:hypothetical protein